MKRYILYFALLTAGLVLGKPFPSMDVAKLQPVEAICIYRDGTQIVAETDLENKGVGDDVEAAFADLKAHAKGIVFLDTADYVLARSGCEDQIQALTGILRPACQLCMVQGEGMELSDILPFLHGHETDLTLADYRAGKERIPTLYLENGRITFES